MKILYLDVETTGLTWPECGIIQLAGLVEVGGDLLEGFNFHVRPFVGDVIEAGALDVCGITREEMAGYEPPEKVMAKFQEILARYVDRYDKRDKFHLVAYNAEFDYRHLRAWFEKCGDEYFGSWFWHPPIDVMGMAAVHLMRRREKLADFKLATVAGALGIGIDADALHDAKYDIELTREMFLKLVQSTSNLA